MDIHCKKCKEDIMEPISDAWESWTRLTNYFEIQYLSGNLKKKMYEKLIDDLMYLQPIDDEIEEFEEENENDNTA